MQNFWKRFQQESGRENVAFKGTICFGDNHDFADNAAIAAANGEKTAMTYPENGYRTAMKGMPAVGDLNIVVNWAGEPVCVIETVKVEKIRFNEVDEALQAAEYTGAASWREIKEAECKREIEELGGEFDENIVLIAEEFKAVFRA